MAKLSKDEWARLNQNIKMQRSLIKNGRTPHIRDMARNRLKLVLDKKRKAELEWSR
jgi:hypothetical protein